MSAPGGAGDGQKNGVGGSRADDGVAQHGTTQFCFRGYLQSPDSVYR